MIYSNNTLFFSLAPSLYIRRYGFKNQIWKKFLFSGNLRISKLQVSYSLADGLVSTMHENASLGSLASPAFPAINYSLILRLINGVINWYDLHFLLLKQCREAAVSLDYLEYKSDSQLGALLLTLNLHVGDLPEYFTFTLCLTASVQSSYKITSKFIAWYAFVKESVSFVDPSNSDLTLLIMIASPTFSGFCIL